MASASRRLVAVAASRLHRPFTVSFRRLQAVWKTSPATSLGAVRSFASQPYYLRGKMLHCSDRPSQTPVYLNGRNFEHWLVVTESPPGDPLFPDVPRDKIIEGYIQTLAKVVGSEEIARELIYSVSTRCYFGFGCLISEDVASKIRELPKVRWVLPDSYVNVEEKTYGGEPFVNGKALPYDSKCHLEWMENEAEVLHIAWRNHHRHADGQGYGTVPELPSAYLANDSVDKSDSSE